MAASKKPAPGRKPPKPGNPDKRIRELADLLKETGLSEIEIEEGGRRLRVAVGGAVAYAPPGAATAAPMPAQPTEAGAADEAGKPRAGTMTSPMVGTVYLSPEPGADPFMKAGEKVEMGQTMLIIEAMKVMNPIPAPRSGTVVEIMVADAEPVEYGQPLLVIE